MFQQRNRRLAEYRNGHYPAADEALRAAPQAGKDNPHIFGTSTFYRAMSLFRQAKETEARQLFTEGASEMKPLPADEKNLWPAARTQTISSCGWRTRKPRHS